MNIGNDLKPNPTNRDGNMDFKISGHAFVISMLVVLYFKLCNLFYKKNESTI